MADESKESGSLTEEERLDCSISLHLACVLGHERLVKQLLAECPGIINAMSSVNKLTAVHVAAKHGHEKVLDLLLACSPDLIVAHKNSGEDRTPLHLAAENGHDKIVEKLLVHSPGLINTQDADLKTALHLAIERGHDLVVAQLMRYNPNFELEAMIVRDNDDNEKKRAWQTKSAVYLAVEQGHEKIVALLLAREPSATAHIRDCLHRAVRAGHTNIVAQLLTHSPASVHAVNHMQESALHFAAECRRSVEIAEVLLAANAAIDAVDRFKASALDRAVDMGCTELVEFLLARNALVTDNHDDGYDPLIFRPVIDSHSEIVAMLLAHSPHLLDARTKGDNTNALHHATDPEIVQQLLSLNPALLVESDRNGVSPFHTAVMNNRDKVVTRMLALSNEQTLEVLLTPELVKLSSGMLLRCLLDRHDECLMSQAFVTKVWELDKQAVHVVNLDNNETPFHIALRRDLDWAIEMMQGQLSFDEIEDACKHTRTSQDRFRHNVNIEQLSADVTEVVCEYLGFESARKRVGKRTRDDEQSF